MVLGESLAPRSGIGVSIPPPLLEQITAWGGIKMGKMAQDLSLP